MADVFGTDVHRDWTFMDDDIELASSKTNLEQAVYNRLKTDWDFYTDFYTKYGGRLYEHFGDFNHPTIHEYIRIEIEDILAQDTRIRNMEVTVNKISSNSIEVNLKLTLIGSDEVEELNLVLNDDSSIAISPINESNSRS